MHIPFDIRDHFPIPQSPMQIPDPAPKPQGRICPRTRGNPSSIKNQPRKQVRFRVTHDWPEPSATVGLGQGSTGCPREPTVGGDFLYCGPRCGRLYVQIPGGSAFDQPCPISYEQGAVTVRAVVIQEKGSIIDYPRGADSRSKLRKRDFFGLADVPSATVNSGGGGTVSRTDALPQSMKGWWTPVICNYPDGW